MDQLKGRPNQTLGFQEWIQMPQKGTNFSFPMATLSRNMAVPAGAGVRVRSLVTREALQSLLWIEHVHIGLGRKQG